MLARMNGYVLVAIGSLGMAMCEMALRLLHPSFLANDFAHGLCIGVFLGLQILGLRALWRAERRNTA
jgi:hypothetical protein